MQSTLRLFLILFLLVPTATWAFPIAVPGTEGEPVIVNTTGDVIATYQGNSALSLFPICCS